MSDKLQFVVTDLRINIERSDKLKFVGHKTGTRVLHENRRRGARASFKAAHSSIIIRAVKHDLLARNLRRFECVEG